MTVRKGAVARLGGVLVLIGALVAVAAIPAGGVLLAGAHWADHQRAELPAQLLSPPTAQLTRVYADDGKTLITTFFDQDRQDVALAQIAPVMQQAIVAAEAKKLGISFSAPNDAGLAAHSADSWGSFTLGVVDTTPLELASAYATVAAEGKYCAPLPVASITDDQRRAIPVSSDCKQVLDPDVARAATDAARCPVGQQSAFGKCDGGTAAQVDSIFGGRPVAGKTGSTEDNATETFVGFTRTVAAAGTANDPADPCDHVGSAVESRVVTAVAKALRVAAGDGEYPDFTPPSAEVAFGG